MEGDALKIESRDDLSGVEAVFVDENRINSLTDGKASVALKDYAGTEKQVSIYAKDYAGNRSDVVKLDNPYYKEPAPEKKPIRFFCSRKKREQMIEDESKEPLYEQNHEEEIDDSESKIAAKIDLV